MGRCRAKDIAFGRCVLERRHDGQHRAELIHGVKTFVWGKGGSAAIELHTPGGDRFTITPKVS